MMKVDRSIFETLGLLKDLFFVNEDLRGFSPIFFAVLFCIGKILVYKFISFKNYMKAKMLCVTMEKILKSVHQFFMFLLILSCLFLT